MQINKNQGSDNIPALRFPEFKGEWEKKKLGEISKFSKGKGIPKSDISENGLTKCIRYGELYTRYTEVIKDVYSRTNVDLKHLVLSEANDVIIPASGETQIDIATACCVIEAGIALGGDLNIIKTDNNGVFLSYYLNNRKKMEIANLAQGISVVHLYSSQLALLSLNLPILSEQEKIASFFTAIDQKIQALQQQKQLLQQYKKGIMQQLFTQQLRFKDDNGKDYPDWEEKYGDDVFKNVTNKEHDSSLPILAITQEFGAIPRDLIDYKVSVTDKSVESYKVVEIGDFIISLRSFQGGIEYSNYNGICSPAYNILRSKISIDTRFYKFYFKTEFYIKLLNKKLEGIRDGKMISFKYFSEISIPYPSLPEQIKIANFLSSIDEKINHTQTQIQQATQWKKGLLQTMFC